MQDISIIAINAQKREIMQILNNFFVYSKNNLYLCGKLKS